MLRYIRLGWVILGFVRFGWVRLVTSVYVRLTYRLLMWNSLL
jgi:hypothetical protein